MILNVISVDGMPEIYSELKTWSRKHEVHLSGTERHKLFNVKGKYKYTANRAGNQFRSINITQSNLVYAQAYAYSS